MLYGTRALANRLAFPASQTVEGCLDACTFAGYSLCGVEYYGECWGANTLDPTSQPLNDRYCDLPCTDNPLEYCGGNTGSASNAAFQLFSTNPLSSSTTSSSAPPATTTTPASTSTTATTTTITTTTSPSAPSPSCSAPFATTCTPDGSALTCQPGHYFVPSTSTCTSDASCPSSTRFDGLTSCISCPLNAATCSSDGATSCVGNYVLYEGACTSKFCPTSFVNQAGVCTACSDPYAAVCSGDKSVTCLSGHKLVKSTSICTPNDACPSATYDDENGSCISCPVNAASCNSSGATACSGSYVLYDKASSLHRVLRPIRCDLLELRNFDLATAATSCYQPPRSDLLYLYNGKCITALQCRLQNLLVLAYLKENKPTTTGGVSTYECTTCPGILLPALDGKSCLFRK
ncbi:hypothetical protein JCM8097_002680 [Rhodosporidiobolus ruineniae]